MDARYSTNTLGIGTPGSVTAAQFGALVRRANGDDADMRSLLAAARTLGYGPAPCGPSEISDEDVAEAVEAYADAD